MARKSKIKSIIVPMIKPSKSGKVSKRKSTKRKSSKRKSSKHKSSKRKSRR